MVRRILLVAVMGLLLCPAAPAQWREASIRLPDSLGGLRRPEGLAVNAARNKAYVSSWEYGAGGVTVFDGSGMHKLARVEPDLGIGALCFDSLGDKLYCGGTEVLVVDGMADTVRARIALPDYSGGPLCVNPNNRRAYVTGWSGIAVIDARADTLCGVIPVSEPAQRMCYSPAANKLYCASSWSSRVFVIDCALDSVVAAIEISSSAMVLAMCQNATGTRIYCAQTVDTLLVIDVLADTVRARLPVSQGINDICLVPQANRVYAASLFDDNVVVIDATADQVIATIPLPYGSGPWSVCHVPDSNEVYCALSNTSQVAVIDVATNQVKDSVSLGAAWSGPMAIAYNAASRRTLVAGLLTHDVTAIDAATTSVVGHFLTGCEPDGVCFDPLSRRVFCSHYWGEHLSVVDGRLNRADTVIRVGWSPSAICLSPVAGQLCCAVDSTLLFIDCASLDVLGTVAVGSPQHLLLPDNANCRVYCANSGAWPVDSTVTVIDPASRHVTATVSVGPGPHALCLSPTSNRLYCSLGGGVYGPESTVVAIDCSTNTVAARIRTGQGPGQMAWDEQDDQVYCANTWGMEPDSTVAVIDCATNSVVARVTVGYDPGQLCYSPFARRVYAIANSQVKIIDAEADIVVDSIAVPFYPGSLLRSPGSNRLFIGGAMYDTLLLVYDEAGDSVLCQIPVGPGGHRMVQDLATGRIYVAEFSGSSLSVIRDSLAGAVGEKGISRQPVARPTIVRGLLMMPHRQPSDAARPALLDACGRKVLDLSPGPNDVSRLAAGVYFIQEAGSGRRLVTRVVITR